MTPTDHESQITTAQALGGDALSLEDKARRPILVTGMHRSGTTWLGRMLCAGREMIEVREPLNVDSRQTILRAEVDHWYMHVNHENEDLYLRDYRDAIAFRVHPIHDIRRAQLGSPKDPLRILKRWSRFLVGRIGRRGLLIKDPFAVFSLDWFARRLGCHIVVIVRHPLAVVSSLKRLDFAFDFRNLLEQPSLMSNRLERFRPEMESAIASSDIVEQGSLLWRIVYDSVAMDQARDPWICVVRHEDLSLRPMQEYARLYEQLGLTFSEKAKRTIEQYTSGSNPKEVSKQNPFRVRLDSQANLSNWRRRLDDEEIDRILRTTRPVVERFYPDEDVHMWAPRENDGRGG
jgi:hypothetical protein